MPKIICVGNQKGGIGKTTTATNLAAMLNKRGKKTLLIDADAQGNSSDTYRAEIEGMSTIYDLLLEEEKPDINDIIQKTEIGDIIPSDPLLREADTKLPVSDTEGYTVLKEALSKLKGYEYVIIDTNPALNMPFKNALVAADTLIIPLTTSRYAITALDDLMQTIDDAKILNDKLKVSGILLINYKATTNIAKDTHKELINFATKMDTKLFETVIRACVKVEEAQAVRTTLDKYSPRCNATKDYEKFVDELINNELTKEE